MPAINNEELLEKIKDPKHYLENFCKIKTKEQGLAPFILNEAQKDLFNTLRKSNRIIILKARQMGFSTAATGYLFHKTITTPGINSALIGYNSELVTELLDKVKTFYRTAPESIRPKIQYNSKFEISFPAIDSKIIVLPSTENVGRGYTLHNVLCTELSAWEKAEEKMSTLEASVPINGQIIIESTPRGQGNLYHRMWMSDNDYVKKEYGWWWHYSEEEIRIIEKRMNNASKFAQEYGLEFLASGRSVFDAVSIRKQRKNQLSVGDINTSVVGKKTVVHVVNDLRIYSDPDPSHLYVLGADVAEGVEGGDYSVAVIWDRMTGEEVAFYRGHIEPDKFAVKLNDWGRRFNNALMIPEINNHGLTTVTCLKQLFYPSMYFRPSHFEKIASKWSEKLGWKTTKVTRPLLIDDFAQAVRDNVLMIHSKELLDEMSVFVYDRNNNMVPQEGFHDDCIFAGGIGFQGFKVLYDKPLEQIDYTQHLPISGGY